MSRNLSVLEDLVEAARKGFANASQSKPFNCAGQDFSWRVTTDTQGHKGDILVVYSDARVIDAFIRAMERDGHGCQRPWGKRGGVTVKIDGF